MFFFTYFKDFVVLVLIFLVKYSVLTYKWLSYQLLDHFDFFEFLFYDLENVNTGNVWKYFLINNGYLVFFKYYA